jgi:NADPH-dependent 2,4-dienoyl-CoA reductase/sulfur reductase-like enzyme
MSGTSDELRDAPGLVSADVAVIGGGPAGIAAAAHAAESGARVVLLDEGPRIGGQIWRHSSEATLGSVARRWIDRLHRSGATIHTGASVVDVHSDEQGWLVLAERSDAPSLVRARALVLATGARERFLAFPGWTLPGVIGVGGAQALLKAGTPFAGKRVVIAGSGPLLLPVASALVAKGAQLLLVAEQAHGRAVRGFAASLWKRPRALLQAARYRAGFLRARYRTNTWVVAARGDERLQTVELSDGGRRWSMSCDVLCAGFGLVPNTELARLIGCSVAHGTVEVDGRQQTSRQSVFCAGEPTGVGGVDLALAEGAIAGLSAVGSERGVQALVRKRERLRAFTVTMDRVFAPRAELRALATPETIVCRCEDVVCGAIDRHWSPRQAKLYTRAGMGPCQGRVCGAALQFLYGWPADTVRLPAQASRYATLLAEAGHSATPTDIGA